ncbi:MAG: hypothetical protein IPP55_15305 [Anaerolineales bacterium]|nr:hypothetical protein [Anaerolineales bacterium]
MATRDRTWHVRECRAIGVDGSGNVVVADFGTGRIQIFDANGTYISEFLPDDFERT